MKGTESNNNERGLLQWILIWGEFLHFFELENMISTHVVDFCGINGPNCQISKVLKKLLEIYKI
jgi:hypothetical protein